MAGQRVMSLWVRSRHRQSEQWEGHPRVDIYKEQPVAACVAGHWGREGHYWRRMESSPEIPRVSWNSEGTSET